jgi:hypothetical protein
MLSTIATERYTETQWQKSGNVGAVFCIAADLCGSI